MSDPFVFVSHASADSELARTLVERLLQLGCGVPAKQIFFTSATSTGVPAGTDFRAYIKDRAQGAGLVIAVVTQAYLDSSFCMTEVGAAWVLGKDFYPIAAPTLPYSSLNGILPGLHIPRMDGPGVLDDLADRVCNALAIVRGGAEWGANKSAFERSLPTLSRPAGGGETSFAGGRHSDAGLRQAVAQAPRRWLQESLRGFREDVPGAPVYSPTTPLEGIRAVVESAHRELERHYGAQGLRDFKVNFMTRSYRDGAITIARWANRDDRQPSSLARRRTDPTLYDTTKTAVVYGMAEPQPLIVDDTHRPEHGGNYVLDPHQRDRIRSHLVWPVLSPMHDLLGTFVIDCDEPCFFMREDEDVWRSFCEAHVEPIALEKLRLDSAILRPRDQESAFLGPSSWKAPPF